MPSSPFFNFAALALIVFANAFFATVEFALRRDDLGGPFREYLKSLKL